MRREIGSCFGGATQRNGSPHFSAASFGERLPFRWIKKLRQTSQAEWHEQVDAKLHVVGREHVLGGEDRPILALDSLRETVARHSPEPYPSPPLDRSSRAQIIFTSGTTAEPKGVILSHGNILANLEPLEAAMQPYLKWERPFHPLRFLDLVPLSHVFGQFMGMWVPPLLGATVLFQDTLNPTEIISTIARERVSVLIAVPRVARCAPGQNRARSRSPRPA